MNILILGASGFVGKNVSESLSKISGISLHKVSLRDSADLTSYQDTTALIETSRPDVIINCAAKVGSLNYVTQQAANVFDINMRILLNIFRAIQEKIPGCVLINPVANCAYPGNIDEYREDMFWMGKVHQSVLAYGSTRRMIDVLSECYRMQFDQKTINLIVPNMYGQYDSTDPNKAHALNALISKIVKAKNEKTQGIEIWGSGIAVREWLYAKDFAGIICEVISDLSKYVYKEPFNVAQNYGLSIRELLEMILQITGYTGNITWNKNMPDGAPRKVMNDIRFRKYFPDFSFTDLKSGIEKTVIYYESIFPY